MSPFEFNAVRSLHSLSANLVLSSKPRHVPTPIGAEAPQNCTSVGFRRRPVPPFLPASVYQPPAGIGTQRADAVAIPLIASFAPLDESPLTTVPPAGAAIKASALVNPTAKSLICL